MIIFGNNNNSCLSFYTLILSFHTIYPILSTFSMRLLLLLNIKWLQLLTIIKVYTYYIIVARRGGGNHQLEGKPRKKAGMEVEASSHCV